MGVRAKTRTYPKATSPQPIWAFTPSIYTLEENGFSR
jgi:hypothetical protein